jgi:16S rRNA (cytidine1402-2'-O)-methyltransferase
MNSKTGALYIVATPIGNLDDMTFRAVEVLKQADLVLAEDTRHASILFRHFNIRTPLLSCHEHNERKRAPEVMDRLVQGQQISLISDAGTPLISDPGYPLVREARRKGLRVVPIPGASAIIAALSASGLPTDRFYFGGFIPAKPGPRREYVELLVDTPWTSVFYESSHRILQTMEQICASLGHKRQIAVARELTKKYEQFYIGEAQHVLNQISAGPDNQKGEFVIIVGGAADVVADDSGAKRLLELLIEELPLKTACKIVAKWSGLNRNQLYQLGLEIQSVGE